MSYLLGEGWNRGKYPAQFLGCPVERRVAPSCQEMFRGVLTNRCWVRVALRDESTGLLMKICAVLSALGRRLCMRAKKNVPGWWLVGQPSQWCMACGQPSQWGNRKRYCKKKHANLLFSRKGATVGGGSLRCVFFFLLLAVPCTVH